jgi:hypothetical protein
VLGVATSRVCDEGVGEAILAFWMLLVGVERAFADCVEGICDGIKAWGGLVILRL